MADTVTVGCKLPSGLVIRLGALADVNMGGQTVKMFRANGRSITLNGYNNGPSFFGVGFTEGVGADDFRAWAEAHREFEPLAKGLIFEVKRSTDAPAAARSLEGVKSGFESIDPEDPAPGVTKAKED